MRSGGSLTVESCFKIRSESGLRAENRNHFSSTHSQGDRPMSDLQSTIEAAWDARDGVNVSTTGAVRVAVDAAIGLLDSGKARVAEKLGNEWTVNQWLKKAVLLSFRLNPN